MAQLGFIFIERDLYENSYHLMPRPGFELTSVELAPLLWDLNSGLLCRTALAMN